MQFTLYQWAPGKVTGFSWVHVRIVLLNINQSSCRAKTRLAPQALRQSVTEKWHPRWDLNPQSLGHKNTEEKKRREKHKADHTRIARGKWTFICSASQNLGRTDRKKMADSLDPLWDLSWEKMPSTGQQGQLQPPPFPISRTGTGLGSVPPGVQNVPLLSSLPHSGDGGAGQRRRMEETNMSLLDMEITGERTSLPSRLNAPEVPIRQRTLTEWQQSQKDNTDLIKQWKKEQQVHNENMLDRMMDMMSSIKQEFSEKQEGGAQIMEKLLEQHGEYMRGQVSDTVSWRLQQNHSEVLKSISRIMSPMNDAISQLQNDVSACTHQLHSVVEEITTLKQHTVITTQAATSTKTVQATHEATSPLLPPVAKARLRLQSTMQQADGLLEALPSPFGMDLRGRFIGKSPVNLQFPCFGRMEDNSDPVLYLEQCQDYLSLHPLTDGECLATLRSVLHGAARDWWDVMRLEIRTWKDFECNFLSAFLSEEYVDELEERVRSQVQGETESIRDFAYKYRSLCRCWKSDITEAKVIQLLLKNIHPRLASQLRSSGVKTVDDLVRLGQQLEKDWEKHVLLQPRPKSSTHPNQSQPAVAPRVTTSHPPPSQVAAKSSPVVCWRCKESHPPYSCPLYRGKTSRPAECHQRPQQPSANSPNPSTTATVQGSPIPSPVPAFPFSAAWPYPRQLFVTLSIGLENGRALVDTGSSYTLLSEELWHVITPAGSELNSWSGDPLYLADGGGRWPLGWHNMTLTLQGYACTLPVVVLPSGALACPVFLGLDFISTMGLKMDVGNNHYWFKADARVKYCFEQDTSPPGSWGWKGPLCYFSAVDPRSSVKSTADSLDAELLCKAVEGAHMDPVGRSRLFHQLQENSDICTSQLGCTAVLTHKIFITQNVPIKQRPYRVSPAKLQVMKELVEEMLEMDVIEPSSSAWSSPVVLIPRKDRKPRFCVNYIKLNAVTYTDAYPLPTIQEILDSLAGSVIFSSLDLNNGYWQCRMDHDSIDKTAFSSPLGLFQFKVMPFGLKNAPATFQRLMETTLGELRGRICFVYLDDIIIFSNSPEQHFMDIQSVLNKLRDANLTVNMKKSKFFQTSLQFLGHIVSAEGIQVNPEKTKAVEDFPVPTNLKEVQRFLGMSGWYHRFVPNFAQIAEPLNALKRKGVRFRWTPECQNAFETLKSHLVSSPILGHPNFTLPFVVYTDASDVGLGAVLIQQTGLGTEEVLAYGSRSLNSAERNYSTTEKECLAVVWSLEKWRYYLEGRSFSVVTDHSSLVWVFKTQKPSARLIRWVLRLQEFTFTVEYRKGKYNTVPDALSRAPSDAPVSETSEQATLMSVKGGDPSRELPITDEEIWRGQQEDLEIQKIYQRIMEGGELTVNDVTKFTILEDKVYRVLQLPHKTIYQVYIPAHLRESLLGMLHEDTISGHLGRYKTYKRLQALVYWPGMSLEVKSYVQNCQICQQYKPECRKLAGKLQQTVVTKPWEMLGVDFMGPFPRSVGGNVYLAVFVDYYTRWVELYPLRRATAETVSKVLTQEILTRWGVPDFILSDQGSQFISSVFKETCASWNLRQKMTSAYHPQTNLTERINRTLKGMIASYVADKHKTWDKHLADFRFALNSAVHETTGVSPAELNLGRTLRGPLDVMLQPWTASPSPDSPAYKTVKELAGLRDLVQDNIHKGRLRQKKNYDNKRREMYLQVDDRVWLRSHPYSKAIDSFTAKLAPKWLGPYRVLAQVGPVNYDIVREDTGEGQKVVHVSRIKPCYPSAKEMDELERQRVLDILAEDSDEEEFLGFPSSSL